MKYEGLGNINNSRIVNIEDFTELLEKVKVIESSLPEGASTNAKIEELKIAICDKLDSYSELAVDRGTATGGSNNTLIDTTKKLEVNVWQNAKMEIHIGSETGDSYTLNVVSCDAEGTYHFNNLPNGVEVTAGSTYQIKQRPNPNDFQSVNGFTLEGRDWSQDFKKLDIPLSTLRDALTGSGAAAKTLADVDVAIKALRTIATLDTLETAIGAVTTAVEAIGTITKCDTDTTKITQTVGLKADELNIDEEGNLQVDVKTLPAGLATSDNQAVIDATLNAIGVLLTSIRDTAGIKKIVDKVGTTVADGDNAAMGTKADAAATVFDATPFSIIALLKGVGNKLGAVVNAAGTAIIGKVGIDQTLHGTTNKVAAFLRGTKDTDGTESDMGSFTVDPNGRNVQRFIDAAPFAYDEASGTKKTSITKMDKSTVATAHNAITASVAIGSCIEIDAKGYTSIKLYITISGTGTWKVDVYDTGVSGGSYALAYDGSSQSSTGNITESRNPLFRGIGDYVKIVPTEDAGNATLTVDYQLLN